MPWVFVYIWSAAVHWLISHSASVSSELNAWRQEVLEEIGKEEAKAKGEDILSVKALSHWAAVDMLDAFMSSVERQVEADKVQAHRHCATPWIFIFLLYFNSFLHLSVFCWTA